MIKKLIVGNWKMNLSVTEASALAQQLVNDVTDVADLAVCPVFPHLGAVSDILKVGGISMGAQDCSTQDNGAFTGQVSAEMLNDVGCTYVIVGHSERRQHNSETSGQVAKKAQKALDNGLSPIICVGETLEQRESGKEKDVVGFQLAQSIPEGAMDYVVAYEPIWAIGTGKVANAEDVAEMHAFIRTQVGASVRILYGGSMKPDNASELLATQNVDGGLIGGASLTAESFLAIAKSV